MHTEVRFYYKLGMFEKNCGGYGDYTVGLVHHEGAFQKAVILQYSDAIVQAE